MCGLIKILCGFFHLLRAERKAFSVFFFFPLEDQFFRKQSWSITGAFYFLNYVYKLWYAYHSLFENSVRRLAKPRCTWSAIHKCFPGQS